MPSRGPHFGRAVLALLWIALAAGCATPPLQSARSNYYFGHFNRAEANLANLPADNKDKVLYLMERGAIRQALRRYEDSTRDWLEAVALERELETHSASRATASMLVNDLTLNYRGPPFERTLLHCFLAKNYFARALWDDAAVEARNIIAGLQNLEGFPDDAYSRYLAGFCMEMSGEENGAYLQYQTAAGLVKDILIDPATGRFAPGTNGPATNAVAILPAKPGVTELVCFVGMDRAPAPDQPGVFQPSLAPYAEFFYNGARLGRSYTLANTAELTAATLRRMAARKAGKEIARVAVKVAIAEAVSQKDEALGELVRLLLFSTEQPDLRHWQTLPRWLGVARFPCPADMKSYDVVFYNGSGTVTKRLTVTEPLTRRWDTYVSFCRDILPLD